MCSLWFINSRMMCDCNLILCNQATSCVSSCKFNWCILLSEINSRVWFCTEVDVSVSDCRMSVIDFVK